MTYAKLNCLNGLVWFYGISTFVGYLTPNPFYVTNQFYFKQFSSAWVHSLSKTFLFKTIQFIQAVRFGLLGFMAYQHL